MKLILNHYIIVKSENHAYKSVTKEMQTDLVPMPGMEIEDGAWKNPRVIQRVTMNPDENYYFVWTNDDEVETYEHADRLIKMYKSHDWN
ncbi:hypothetical protein [Photobacterium toruni]|uniref:Uncharacterized protein n=1 Tax=Photobacterium toruni TaxID=1935446 RepID=A0A1T4V0M9_9GAMM|nr:hypothetical protein [Photobacterium toruni]SKA58454.1 hypothetical protein CZ814_03972 [Photobacterium toruni]